MDNITRKNQIQNNKTKKLKNSLNTIRDISNNSSLNNKFVYESVPPNIILKYRPIEFEESSEILELDEGVLKLRFRELTETNLTDSSNSRLVIKKYNTNKNIIEVSNDSEFLKLHNFIKEGQDLELDEEENQSNIGKIIMEGYKRFLHPNNYFNYDFKKIISLLLENPEKDLWYNLKETDSKIKLCWRNLPGQYLESLDDRYKYIGCICIHTSSNKRIPIYQDRNGDYAIPTMRKIVKFFFTMINITKKSIFLDYDVTQNQISIILDDLKELVKYQVSEKGILFYDSFPEYLNIDYLEDIKQEENKHSK